MANSVDRVALWNIVATVDAFLSSGFTPTELMRWVHPSLVASTQGTGMGGMTSMQTMYHGNLLGRNKPNDILQEALPNVIAAHVVGIGALVLSREGARVVSTDLSERATQFARFNCALNQRDNVEVMSSDLYTAVEGQTFDCIVAHLPWITEVGGGVHDAYAAGESLVKRVVAGLTETLRPGGVRFALTQGRDTKEGKFEDRVRAWLKDQADEFDILFGYYQVLTSQEILKTIARRDRTSGPEAMARLESEFEQAGLSEMLFGGLYIRRHNGRSREPWTVRRKLSDATRGADVMSALILHDWLSGPESVVRILASTPLLAPGLQITSSQVVQDAALVPGKFIFETNKPFVARDSFDPWTARMLARFDAKTTVAKVVEDAQADATIPDSARQEEFVALVAHALAAGYLNLPDD